MVSYPEELNIVRQHLPCTWMVSRTAKGYECTISFLWESDGNTSHLIPIFFLKRQECRMQTNTLDRLLTPQQLIERYRGLGLTEGSLRWALYHREHNGLSDCVVRRGPRRLLIDVDRFEAWLRKQG